MQKAPDYKSPPDWTKEAIWYQIFVERFHNGDSKNDPTPEDMNAPPIGVFAPEGWKTTPWSHNWYQKEPWAEKSGKDFNDANQYRRYGGDLQGVLDKLDYLQELGVNALFFNPLNDAPSLHKYDARYYHHIDIHFGPDPEGDKKLIAAENPADPTTWKWTAADKLFLKLVSEAHRRGMHIIMDYSWNHTGTMFWAWQDILKNQEKSPYKNWYDIKSFADPARPGSTFSYNGWLNISSLPEIKKVNITTERKVGHPYEGDIQEGPKKHIFDVASRWLAPDGDITKGIDGFRLDVADQIGLGFWRDFRKHVRRIQPNAYLVGEIWWEEWPDKLMDPSPYTQGDVFDAVMFYQLYRPARYFFAKTDFEINASQFRDSLTFQWNRLRPETRYAMMNVSSTHDAPRLLTDFSNPNKYKAGATPHDNKSYHTGKPDEETYRRVRLYLVHLFTNIGAPQIWNGEEMGMWGADDPDCRKPLMWKGMKFDPEYRNNYQPGAKQYDKIGFNQKHFDWYKKLIAIRKANPVLTYGDIQFLKTASKTLVYRRFKEKEEIIVAFNLGAKAEKITIPAGSYINLLTGKKITKKEISLESLSSAILKKI